MSFHPQGASPPPWRLPSSTERIPTIPPMAFCLQVSLLTHTNWLCDSSYLFVWGTVSSSRVKIWWLILCANLSGLKDAQRASKIFLDISVMVPLEKISIWISGLSKGDQPHHCRWATFNSLRAPNGAQRQGICSLCLSWAIFPCLRTLELQVLETSSLNWNSWAFGLQTESHCQLSWFFSF